jgi:triosephosphate isomerase
VSDVYIVLCPAFTALYPLGQELSKLRSVVELAGQNTFWKTSGAYTGQVSPEMLTELGVMYVIIGHSEPRGRFGVPEPGAGEDFYRYFGESDHTVNLKITAALASGLIPILCVGETLAERKEGNTDSIVQTQIQKALAGISQANAASKLVVAYEPVWAIGTGETCDALEANRVCGMIRAEIASLYSAATAEAIRIQYGGSMKGSNASELLAQEHIDGGLVGGASLVPADFAAIVSAAAGA